MMLSSHTRNLHPLVSVIVPNYNHARYLDQRIQTIINQSYKNIEVIILDDCSTDNSLEVIGRYSDNPSVSCVVVNDINTGSPFKQWEKGLSLAKGELIWIAESDDYSELHFLERMVPFFMNDESVVLSFSSYVLDYGDGHLYKTKVRKPQFFSGTRFVSHWMSLSVVVYNASGVLFRKEAYLQSSKDYLSFRAAGDFMFWTQIAMQGKVVFCPENLAYFRRHEGTVTSKSFASGNDAFENKRVVDYMQSRIHFPWYLREMLYSARKSAYYNGDYENDDIRKKVIQLYGFDNNKSTIVGDSLLWIHMMVQRHLGVLI